MGITDEGSCKELPLLKTIKYDNTSVFWSGKYWLETIHNTAWITM